MFSAPTPSKSQDVTTPQTSDNVTSFPTQDPPTVNVQTNLQQAPTAPGPVVEVEEEVPTQESPLTDREQTPLNPPSSPQIFNPDRPTRRRKEVQVYDANSGTYKDRTS